MLWLYYSVVVNHCFIIQPFSLVSVDFLESVQLCMIFIDRLSFGSSVPFSEKFVMNRLDLLQIWDQLLTFQSSRIYRTHMPHS